MLTALATKVGYAAIGMTSITVESVAGAVDRLAKSGPARELSFRAVSSARAVVASRPASPFVDAARGLERRGRAVVDGATERASRTADSVVMRVGTSDMVVHMVNGVVGRVIWPIVDEVLPGVIERLAADPQPVQSIVIGQSTGVATDLADAARAGAAHADERVAAFVDRVLHRASRATPVPATRPLGALPP